jgi:hypothetical protein
MTERAEACRSKAAECECRAVLAGDANLRTAHLELARQWREMAVQAAHLDRRHAARRL